MSIHLTGWQTVGVCGICGLVILAMLAILICLSGGKTRAEGGEVAPVDTDPEQVGDDTLAMVADIPDEDAEEFAEQYEAAREQMRRDALAEALRQRREAEHLEYELFDVLHDARTEAS